MKVYKVLEGPTWVGDLCECEECQGQKHHWLLCMITDETCKEGEWLEEDLLLPNFDEAYGLKRMIETSMEPVEIEI